MDNEKDMFIKNKLQKDELISKKANDLFDKLNKGEFVMEERTQGTNETIVNQKKKSPKWKKVLATAASLVIVVGAANVYATTQGYDNIFFMIKYLITGEKEKVSGKDNILSDRDITISYEPINITKGLSVIVKKLQIKDNEAKLFVITEEKEELDTKTVPLNFKVFNDNNEKLCDQVSARDEQNSGIVNDELILKDYNNDYKILKLEIYKANAERITTLIINLDEKTVEVEGEKEALTKISEIELKEFLGFAAGLSEMGDASEDEIKIDLACQMLSIKNPQNPQYIVINNLIAYPVSEVDKMLESYLGDYLGDTIKNFKDGKHIKISTKNGNKYYTYATPSDMLYGGECINISNISYCNGLYTMKYTYYYRGPEPDSDVNMDNYDIYEQEIGVTLNEDTKYSKFKIDLCREPIILKKAVGTTENNVETGLDSKDTNTNTNSITNDNSSSQKTNTTTNTNTTNNQNSTAEKIDNYATSMSWTEYWAPGLKLQYPTDFTLTEEGGYWRGDRQGELSTIIKGGVKGIDKQTNEIIESEVEILIYEPQYEPGLTNEEFFTKITGKQPGAAYGVSSGKWYDGMIINGSDREETFTNYHGNWGQVIKIKSTNMDKPNYKVINLINWVMGSLKITSY